MSDANELTIVNLPLAKLVSGAKPRMHPRLLLRLEASLRSVGQIEPLIVTPQGDHYKILNGNARYAILKKMGFKTAPCIKE